MSKTTAGFVLVGGLALTAVSGMFAAWAGNAVGSPSSDLFYDVMGWLGILGALVGLGMFFFGAKRFAQS